MTYFFVFLLLFGEPVKETPNSDLRKSAREVNSLLSLIQRGKSTAALSRVEKLKALPAPYRSFALASLLSLPLQKNKQTEVILQVYPFFKEILAGRAFLPGLGKWLTSDPCAVSPRLRIARIAAELARPAGKAFIFMTLWKSFPGHPKGTEYLLEALATAKTHELKNQKELLRFVLFYAPAALNANTRLELIKTIPCTQRKPLLDPLFRRGQLDLVPQFMGACELPLRRARYHIMKGEYGKALEVLKNQKKTPEIEKLTTRARIHVVPPAREAKSLLALWRTSPSMKLLRSTVKTFLLAGDYRAIRTLLASTKTTGAYLDFVRGYSAYKTGRLKDALKIWRRSQESVWGRDREKLDYWIRKISEDLYPHTIAIRKPVRSFYMRLSSLMNARSSNHPRPLPLFISAATPRGWELSRALATASLNRQLSVGLSLLEQGLPKMASECLYRGLSATSKKRRKQKFDLWRCWDLAEGNPPKCKETGDWIQKKSTLSPQLKSKLALSQSWPHLAPRWGTYLPRPYLSQVRESAARHGVPAALLYGLMLSESHFEPFIVSHASALGLFQVIPPTGNEIATDLGHTQFHVGELLEPGIAIEFGAAYLAKLAKMFGGNWPLAIAAYNAGPHQVRRWLRRKKPIAADEFIEEIPFGETRTYVKLVVGRWTLYARELGETAPSWPTHFNPVSN
ncbi:lytic transglycosylase domain-containing protein [Myxococcota bacterium]|nr:lytic transglycosylase domain-containing protein [Myxococcota bacterium]MBU1536443.1 lytic transglycosylase domain-containing protein [Myxococcota bacterium]